MDFIIFSLRFPRSYLFSEIPYPGGKSEKRLPATRLGYRSFGVHPQEHLRAATLSSDHCAWSVLSIVHPALTPIQCCERSDGAAVVQGCQVWATRLPSTLSWGERGLNKKRSVLPQPNTHILIRRQSNTNDADTCDTMESVATAPAKPCEGQGGRSWFQSATMHGELAKARAQNMSDAGNRKANNTATTFSHFFLLGMVLYVISKGWAGSYNYNPYFIDLCKITKK